MTDATSRGEDRARWLVAAAITVLLGFGLGGHGLWDPWETHYGEVARQILVRGDPINLWWQPGEGPDGLVERRFWSKPALGFWLMAASLWVFGLGADAHVAPMVAGPWPELALRLPMVLLTLATCAVLGATVRRFAGARAGMLAMVACATMPQLALMGRMALTDVPMVATLCWGVCAVAIAELDPDSRPPIARRRVLGLDVPWSRWTAYAATLLVLGGLVPVATIHALSREWVQMLPYEIALGVLAVAVLRARSVRPLAWICAHACFGLSFVAKGLIGPGLAAVTLLTFAAATGRLRTMARAGLLGAGPLAFACVGLPWVHAMIVRKGARFLGVFLVDHQLRRFAGGEQPDARGGVTFFVRALGPATFPWVAVLPAALERLWPRSRADDPATSFRVLVLCWLGATFVVLTLSATKYPHYLLPMLPAVAAAVAIAVDELHRSPRPLLLAGLAAWVLVAVALVRAPATMVHLVTYVDEGPWAVADVDPWIVPLCGIPAAVAVGLAWTRTHARLAAAALVVAAVLVTAGVVHRHVPQASAVWSQRSLHVALMRARTTHADAPLLAWRLNHRGETFYARGRVWVSEHGDVDALHDVLGVGAAPRHAFVITPPEHVPELRAALPGWDVAVVERSPRRVLLRLGP